MKERVLELYDNGHNCAQSLICAHGERFGLSPEQSWALGGPFGGGIGRSTKHICGAISGALVIIGLAFPVDKNSVIESKKLMNSKTNQLVSDLGKKYPSFNCIDILRGNNAKPASMHSEVCKKILTDVCEILDTLLTVG